MNDALARREDQQLQRAADSAQRLTVDQVVARTRLVREVMEAVMKKDSHYGVIPGTKKPTLFLPGAEKLLMTFNLAPTLVVEDLSAPDVARYRVHAHIVDSQRGVVVGAGVGECSSDEEKYRWRKAACKEEFEETPEDRRRSKWIAPYGKKPFQVQQVRTNPADIANTVLKMAKKRALVDGAKSTTAASDVFEQDLEDLPEGMIDPEDAPRTVERPQAKPAEKPAPAPQERRQRPEEPPEDDGAPPPGDPPTEAPARAAEPVPAPAAARGELYIPVREWEKVRDAWHNRGTVTEKQVGRLYAIAQKAGWPKDRIGAELKAGLGIASSKEIPIGEPYDLVVDLFEKYGEVHQGELA